LLYVITGLIWLWLGEPLLARWIDAATPAAPLPHRLSFALFMVVSSVFCYGLLRFHLRCLRQAAQARDSAILKQTEVQVQERTAALLATTHTTCRSPEAIVTCPCKGV